jgi:predicted metal-dependent hydrolase
MTSEVHANEVVIHTPCGPARLRHSARKTLAISVLPDGSLELVAPDDAAEAVILAKVEKRQRWIRKQRADFARWNTHRQAPRHVSGATQRYLGAQYRLKIRLGEPASVKLAGGYFHITCPDAAEEKVRALLDDWMRQRAAEVFARRLKQWEPWCERKGLPAPVLRLVRMRSRWGSAGKKGVIRLNPELIRAPSLCIDYVITHEICHLAHPDHGPAFYRLLARYCPDWRRLKERLESTGG